MALPGTALRRRPGQRRDRPGRGQPLRAL